MLVKNIKFANNKVEIVFEEKSIFVSKENYIENPVSIDSYVNEEKITRLLDYEQVIECKIEVIKKLQKKALTEQEITKIIKEKNLSNDYVREILDSLKRSGLINDEYVGLLLVESLLVKRKGKIEIKKNLIDKGINYGIANKLIDDIDEDVYISNFHKVYEKYLKMYSNRAIKIKEQMIINKLKEYGYEETLIDNIKIEKNDGKEFELAKIQLLKLLKNKKNDLNNYENVNKIKVKLAMKGFSYDIINLVLEEVKSNETY